MLVLVAGNGFFVGAEFALVAVDRTQVERAADGGSRRAALCLGLLRRLSHNLSGAQLGITVTAVLLGFVAEPTIATLIEPVLASWLGEGRGLVGRD